MYRYWICDEVEGQGPINRDRQGYTRLVNLIYLFHNFLPDRGCWAGFIGQSRGLDRTIGLYLITGRHRSVRGQCCVGCGVLFADPIDLSELSWTPELVGEKKVLRAEMGRHSPQGH